MEDLRKGYLPSCSVKVGVGESSENCSCTRGLVDMVVGGGMAYVSGAIRRDQSRTREVLQKGLLVG